LSEGCDLDKEVERVEQGDAWEESDEVVRVEVKKMSCYTFQAIAISL